MVLTPKQCSLNKHQQYGLTDIENMKTNRAAVFLVVISILAIAILLLLKHKIEAHTTPTKQERVEIVQELDRGALRGAWFEDASMVAEMTNNPEAINIVSFLRYNSVLAKPTSTGAEALESAKNDNWFFVIPMTSQDSDLSPKWDEFYSPYESKGFAHFFPDSRFMILKTHFKISPIWRGIMTLHEGRHARQFIFRKYDWEDQAVFCYEERDTHVFQNNLAERLGGEKYTTFVNQLADEMESRLKKEGLSPGEGRAPRIREYTELDEIFGPSECQLEKDVRGTSVWIHANFVMLERSFDAEKVREKQAEFLLNVYTANGLFPQPE